MTDTIKSASATVVDAVPAESATPSNPFTAEDIKIVRDSWEIVKKDMTNVGFELFERYVLNVF